MPKNEAATQTSRRGWFLTTHWSVVLAAGGDSTRALAALEKLCRTYWYPLYAFARRGGWSPQDAEDLVQSFFAKCLAGDFLGGANRERGRFRSYLLIALKRQMVNERERSTARKRGGTARPLELDALTAEQRYAVEPPDMTSPEKLFDRRWALTVLEGVLQRLEREQTGARKATIFAALREFLTSPGRGRSHAIVARELGLTEGAVKVAVHRLRRRYRELLEQEIAHTVASPVDIEDERRHLLAALSA